ncbi:MAG: hypothetical protein IKH61_07400 [Bacteroidales bacterium]|nr:hypothetical protein [Bacteroidales bacterium]
MKCNEIPGFPSFHGFHAIPCFPNIADKRNHHSDEPRRGDRIPSVQSQNA